MMHNTQNSDRYGSIRFPMTHITDWDAYGAQYEVEQRERALRKAEKTRSYALPGFDASAYDEDHPPFGGPEWTEKEKADADRDLKRFLGKRGLLKENLA